MSDERLREVERAVRDGDAAARIRLTQERMRARTGSILFWRGGARPPLEHAIRTALEFTLPPAEGRDPPVPQREPGWAAAIVDPAEVLRLTAGARSRSALLVDLGTGDAVHVFGRTVLDDAGLGHLVETVDAMGRPRKASGFVGVRAVTAEPLYDRVFVDPDSHEARFFSCPLGQRDPYDRGEGPKDYQDTNLNGNGERLPLPEELEVDGISLVPPVGIGDAELEWLADRTTFEFSIAGGQVRLGPWPTRILLADPREAVAPEELDLRGFPVPLAVPVLPLVSPVLIGFGENFYASVRWGPRTRARFRLLAILHGLRAKAIHPRREGARHVLPWEVT